MTFVSYAEKRGIEKAWRETLASFLKIRHKDNAAELLALLDAVTDGSRLAALGEEVFAAEGIDGVRAALASAASLKS